MRGVTEGKMIFDWFKWTFQLTRLMRGVTASGIRRLPEN